MHTGPVPRSVRPPENAEALEENEETGQVDCYDTKGIPRPCSGTEEDGEIRYGTAQGGGDKHRNWLPIMNETSPRYELRAFAHDFGLVEEAIRRYGREARYRESLEIYLMSAGNDENNTKVRGGLLDIKVLVSRDRGLEQWSPRMKREFPLARQAILDEVFPAFGVEVSELKREAYSLQEFLAEVVHPHRDLVAVSVFKQRFGFDIDGCIAELANLYINGASMRTACLESTDADLVLRTGSRIHLDGYENVNYLLAIKRVVGMAPLPADAFYRAW